MYRCVLCGYDVPTDDAVAQSAASGRCVCLCCFAREVKDVHPMPHRLRAELMEVTAGVE